MNGFKSMADSYRTLVEQGKISQADAERDIVTYDFLATCKQDDFYRLVDSGAFNDIIKSYVRKALQGAKVDEDITKRVLEELRWLFDTKVAKEIEQ